MFGAREPRLAPLDERLTSLAKRLRAAVDPGRLRADVEALAEPRSRLHHPEAMRRAQELVADRLRDAGWEPRQHPFTWRGVEGFVDYHDDERSDPTVMYERLDGVNLVASRAGTSAGSGLLIGAHLDSVRDSPGADDNASGVACLLELARLLAPMRFELGVTLAVFDMEEIGLLGSRALVEELDGERPTIGGVIFETIGCTRGEPGSQTLPPGLGAVYRGQVRRMKRTSFRGDWTLVIYRAFANQLMVAFAEALAHLAGPGSVMMARDPVDLPLLGRALGKVAPWVHDFARSDHTSFWNAGIPAIQVTDTANFRNPNYHQPGDLPDTLDYQRLADVTVATAVAVARLARQT